MPEKPDLDFDEDLLIPDNIKIVDPRDLTPEEKAELARIEEETGTSLSEGDIPEELYPETEIPEDEEEE